jgi:hypothetical protein
MLPEAEQGDNGSGEDKGGADADGEVVAVDERLDRGMSVGGAVCLGDGADVCSCDVLRLVGCGGSDGGREAVDGGVPVRGGGGGTDAAEQSEPDGGAELAGGVDDAGGGA